MSCDFLNRGQIRSYLKFRITGLDPANPPFFPDILLNHLSHSDAEMVDIIHTDAGLYGQPIATGTIDFWPNDGMTLQPGCPFRLGIPLSVNGKAQLFLTD